MDYGWDEAKRLSNIEKHAVDGDPPAWWMVDATFSSILSVRGG